MKLAQTLFFVVAAALALAVGSANAADTKAKTDHKASSGATSDKIGTDKNDPGFNKLDKNNDGYLSRTEAAKNPTLVKKFKQVDKNGDGKISRMEYLEAMTVQDASHVKDKAENTLDKHKDKPASTGSTTSK